jgi:hypothetical protein
MSNDAQFSQLLAACEELAGFFPDGLVFIGGIAVYLHAINHLATQEFAEATHDGDFYISIADMAELRDIEEVTPNRRLSKHQLIKGGFEFDVYTERHSSLIVPYSEVIGHAENYGQLKVASLEHLFALKIEAYRDRRSSSKGSKDAKDLIRIASIAAARKKSLNAALIAPYLRDEHLSLLEDLIKRPEFVALTRGNAMQAKKLREQFAAAVRTVSAEMDS